MSYGNPDHTPAFKLWNYYNVWLIPANAAMSITTLSLAGYVKHPNEKKHKEMAEALESVYINTATAASHATDGVTVVIADVNKAKDIFGVISEHLINWRKYLQRGDPTREMKIPLDGLIEFHNLATKLIFIARGHGLYEKPVIDRKFRRAEFNADVKKNINGFNSVVDDGIIKDIISLAGGYGVKPSLLSADFLNVNSGSRKPSRGAIPNVRKTV